MGLAEFQAQAVGLATACLWLCYLRNFRAVVRFLLKVPSAVTFKFCSMKREMLIHLVTLPGMLSF